MVNELPHGTTQPRGLPSPDKIYWPMVPSRELFELQYGKALVASNRRPGAVPVYGTNGQCGFHDESLFRGPGVILGRKGQGPLGVEWSDSDYWVIDTAYSLNPIRSDVDLKYAYHMVKHIGLNHLKDGTSNPTLSRDSFGTQALPLPPLNHQRAIAHILGTLDDKIELNRRMNETLEAMARALFHDWFVAFGPTRAKMAGQEPYLPKHLWDLFPDSIDVSNGAPIPSGWEIKPILDSIQLISGGTPKTAEPSYWDGDIPWASAKDVSQCPNTFLINTERTITEDGLNNSSTKVIPAWSTAVVARGATTGRLCMFGNDIAMNQTCYAISAIDGHHVFTYLNLKNTISELVTQAHGSVFDTITTSTFKSGTWTWPDVPVRAAYDGICRPFFDRILSALLESDSLAKIRDTLLPKLISGELRVPDAERILERAT